MPAPAKFTTPAQYLASLPDDRREAIGAIHRAILKAAPRLKPFIAYGRMIGYGAFHYKYASGREGDGAIVALASQKQHISLYLCASKDGAYLAEANQDQLGQVSVGKACIRFKKVAQLNLPVAIRLVKQASALLKKKNGGDFSL